MRPAAIVCATVAFLGILAAYVGLVLAGHDASGLVQLLVTLGSVLGLGGFIEHRTQQQNATIQKIDKQTNGVLDQRIKDGTAHAVRGLLADAGVLPKQNP